MMMRRSSDLDLHEGLAPRATLISTPVSEEKHLRKKNRMKEIHAGDEIEESRMEFTFPIVPYQQGKMKDRHDPFLSYMLSIFEEEFFDDENVDYQTKEYEDGESSNSSPSNTSVTEGLVEQEKTSEPIKVKGRPGRKRKHLLIENQVNNISRDRTKILLPKIMKTDLRRKYSIMFTNVMNSCCYEFMSSFVRQFAHPRTLIRHEKLFIRKPGETTFQVNLQGIEEIAEYMYGITSGSPDRTFRVSNIQIHTRSDTMVSEIVADFQLRGTKLMNTLPQSVFNFISSMKSKGNFPLQVDSLPSVRPKTQNDDPCFISCIDSLSHELKNEYFPLLPVPKIIEINGILTIRIHDYTKSMRIDEIEMRAVNNTPCHNIGN